MAKNRRKYIISEVKQIDAPNFTMNPVDLSKHFPNLKEFKVKRVYWVNNPKRSRETSHHAHKDEDGVFFFLKGSADLILDDGHGKEKLKLGERNIVYIPRHVWHEIRNMSKDFILLVLSDKNYESSRKGYIENYEDFKCTINDK